MKQLSLFVGLGLVAFAFGLSSDARSARALGDWFRSDGGCTVNQEPRLQHRTVRKRVVKRPGVYELHRRPGVYGYRKVKVRTRSGRVVYRKKRVLVKPYENIVRYRRPKERWVHERQRIYAPAPTRPRGAWPDSC